MADSTIGMGFSITNVLEEFPLYNSEVKGFDTTFSKGFRDYWKGSFQYRLEDVEIKNVNSSVQGLITEGEFTVGSLRPTLTYDSLDRPFFPHRGTRQIYALEFAAEPLGSDVEFWKIQGDFRRYFEIKDNVVYHPRIRVGFATGIGGEKLPAFERFFAGGTSTVRGFKLRDIGPSIGFRSLGGESRFILNNEVQYPLVEAINLSGVGFIDAGNVYNEIDDFDPFTLRYGTGAGIRVLSPVGPIGLDYGIKIDRKVGERQGEFHLRLGSQL